MSHAKVIARNTAWTLADQLLGMMSMLISSIWVAHAMGPEKLGHYSYVTTIAAMTGLVASLGVPLATRKYAAEFIGRGEAGVARAIVAMTYRFQLYTSAVVVAVGMAVVFTRVEQGHRLYSALAVLMLVPYLLYSIPSAAISATEDLSWNVRASVVSTAVNLFGVFLTLQLGWDLPGLAGSLLVSRAIDLAIRDHYYRRLFAALPGGDTPAALPDGLRARMVQFCWRASALMALDVIVWDRSEVFFLGRFSAITEVAFFTQAFNVVQQVLVLPRALAWSADTTLAVQQGRNPETVGPIAAQTMRIMALFTLPAGCGLAALAGPLVPLVYGERYAPMAPVLMLLSLFCFGKALLLPAQSALVMADRQMVLLRWGLLMAPVNIGVALLVIPRYGAVGAALGKGLVQVAATAGLWLVISRLMKVRLPLLGLGKLVVASFAMFAVVRTFVQLLTGLPAIAALPGGRVMILLAGIPLGIVALAVFLRLLRCLEPADRRFLEGLEHRLPGRVRGGYRAFVSFVLPA